MIILTIRTDKPEAEIGLFDNEKQLAYHTWQAHRQLAETLHTSIKELLDKSGKSWADLEGIVMYRGPGSFTGLRIGLSVGNALAYSYGIPAIGSSGEDWCNTGKELLLKGQAKAQTVVPQYGAEAHTTKPK